LIVWTSHPKFLLKKCHLKLTKKYTDASQQSWGTKVPVPAASALEDEWEDYSTNIAKPASSFLPNYSFRFSPKAFHTTTVPEE
jgi:hypothetical protein